eukprot:CAMPEP_0205920330 /NCGR_PEP_ID=MMETSP1325-20131115/11034_1 /ASSEMBLY_ACC=CAM_ASM_000708 /TAXON_ID=236786 /ORGANISM="Florenciella sp., Strain RCC1007" /LENGTH=65 /DNA_ID=CAMNT_0053288013 /DNA_START=279 /DNA_END=473 /DNA_ORIENTATION=-
MRFRLALPYTFENSRNGVADGAVTASVNTSAAGRRGRSPPLNSSALPARSMTSLLCIQQGAAKSA